MRAILGTLIVVMVMAGISSVSLGAGVKKSINKNEQLTGEVVISPANQRIPITEAGQVVETQVIVLNRSEDEQTVDLTVGQIVGAASGDDVIEIRHGVLEGAAAWVELGSRSVTIKPRQSAAVPVTISIPEDVTAGDKAFAVSATQRTSAQVEGSGTVPIYRLTSVFGLELPGDAKVAAEVEKGELDKGVWVRGGSDQPRAVIQYRNTGERFIRPSGKVVVSPLMFGNKVEYDVESFTIYPEGVNGASVRLKELPYMGLARVSAVMTSEVGEENIDLGSVWILPSWWKLAAIGLGLLGIFLIWRLIQWWRYRDVDYDDEEWHDDDEHMASVAAEADPFGDADIDVDDDVFSDHDD